MSFINIIILFYIVIIYFALLFVRMLRKPKKHSSSDTSSESKKSTRKPRVMWTQEEIDTLKAGLVLFNNYPNAKPLILRMFHDILKGKNGKDSFKDRTRTSLNYILRQIEDATLDDVLPWHTGSPVGKDKELLTAFRQKYPKYEQDGSKKMRAMKTDMMTSLNVTESDLSEGCAHCDDDLHYF
jgi:hypothetical protein